MRSTGFSSRGQHDLKRLLAWHSIENVGIIVMGMGLALIGVSAKPAWIALGLAGCLLRLEPRAQALFFRRRIRDSQRRYARIDRLGGLAKDVRTASLFAIGAVATVFAASTAS